MNKFKKATKRIAAVGVAAAYAATTALAGGLNVQDSMVKDNKFFGSVVIGSTADASAANSVIAGLKSQFSGDEEKVEISYKSEDVKGDSLNAIDSKETFNIGETLANVSRTFDDDESSIFEDGELKDDTYTQELVLENGKFDYRVFDEIKGEDTAKAGIFYEDGQQFASYNVEFTDKLDLSDSAAEKEYIGETLTIMGNEFTVTKIGAKKLTLIGGANKVSLGEEESTKVTVDGKEYSIEVQSVSTDKVLLIINGESKSIDLFDTEKVAGVTIAVTDLVQSNRDAVKGYVEFVIGGQKVDFDGTKIEINDEKISDMYDDYEVAVAFTGNNVSNGFSITYSVDKDVLVDKTTELKDVLFDTFRLNFDGLNDVEYSKFTVSTSNNEVSFDGTLEEGSKDLPSEFKLTTDEEDVTSPLYLGSDKDRIFHAKSANIAGLIKEDNEAGVTTTATGVSFDLNFSSSDVTGNMIWAAKDEDEYYLYNIESIDKDDLEVDFTDVIANNDENGLKAEEITSKLDSVETSAQDNDAGTFTIDYSDLGAPKLFLENGLVMDFANLEVVNFDGANVSTMSFSYDSDIVDPDNTEYSNFKFNITAERASDEDDTIELKVLNEATFAANDEVKEDSDYTVYVDGFGTKVTIDEDNKDNVVIETPNKEVEAMFSVNFGATSKVMTKTVVKAEAEEAKAALVKEGYKIVDTKTIEAGEAIAFDIASAITADETTVVENMIVIGGPIANAAAATLLGDVEETVTAGNAVIKYFEEENSVLIYGFTKDDTIAGAAKFNEGNLVGDSVNVEQ